MLIVLGVIVALVVWLVIIYNGLVGLRNQCRNAWSQIDVQLKRRYDLIPNLVEMVKDYMSYEQETLEKVIQARNTAVAAKGPKESAAAEGAVSGLLRQVFALAENYPELKANENVKELQEELTGTENKISFARQFYNDSVMALNNKIEMFPSNIIAGMFNFTQMEFFDIPEAETKNVRVSLRD